MAENDKNDVAALQAHPRFAAASRLAAAGFVDLYQGNRLLNTMVNDRGRLLISLFAVHLHFESLPDEPHAGLTVSRMIGLCVALKICSPGRAKTILMLMRMFGYLAPAPSEADRRLRRLVPTERLMALHGERIRRQLEAVAMVFPVCAAALAETHPDFVRRYVCRYSEQFITGFRYLDRVPDVRLFVERNAGVVILCHLLLSGEAEDAFPPTRPLTAAVSVAAQQFGVSRAHVRRLLQDAVSEGLLEKAGEHFRISPRLARAVNDMSAESFLIVAHCAEAALADLGRGRAGA